MKFGGTSVGDADAMRRMCRIVERERRPRLVVVSALSGVTDQLFAMAAAAGRAEAEAVAAGVEDLRRRHDEMTTQVVGSGVRARVARAVDATCDELASLLHAVSVLHELTPRSADAIVAFGRAAQPPARGRRTLFDCGGRDVDRRDRHPRHRRHA